MGVQQWNVFSTRSMSGCYNRDKFRSLSVTRVEAGSNTSTVTLRVVGGDEKESLKSESKIRKTTLAKASSIYKRQTRPLVSEGVPEKQDRNCQRALNTWS
jgi:hypothetical protein